jgi:hypothetical protein
VLIKCTATFNDNVWTFGIGEGNLNIHKKTLTSHKSLTNLQSLKVVLSTSHHERDLNQNYSGNKGVVAGKINTVQSRPQRFSKYYAIKAMTTHVCCCTCLTMN